MELVHGLPPHEGPLRRCHRSYTPRKCGEGQAGCTGGEAPNCECANYCDYLTDAYCSPRPRVKESGRALIHLGGGGEVRMFRGHVVTHLGQNGNGFIPIYNKEGYSYPWGDRGTGGSCGNLRANWGAAKGKLDSEGTQVSVRDDRWK